MSGLEFPDIAHLSREELEGEVAALRRTINCMRDRSEANHCGDPAPSVLRQPSVGWCVRPPGHRVPHRDWDGMEWVRDYRRLTEQEGGPPNERIGETP